MQSLYQTEDKIEDVKLLLAALRIETAFLTVITLADKKYQSHNAEYTAIQPPSCTK